MSKVCNLCGRGAKTGISRSHSNIASKRKFSVNLQNKKVEGKRLKVCAKCLKKTSKIK